MNLARGAGKAALAGLLMLAIACLSVWGCQSDHPTPIKTGVGGSGGTTPVGLACLDQPGELPRPPSGGLPCELIPPGLQL